MVDWKHDLLNWTYDGSQPKAKEKSQKENSELLQSLHYITCSKRDFQLILDFSGFVKLRESERVVNEIFL